MAVTLDQLQAFVAAVEKGSFRQAAVHLDKHSSTVSNLVNYLEIDTGTDLFERSGRSLSITKKGEELFSYAKSVIREVEQFDDKVESLFIGEPSKLTIAVDTSINNQDIANAITLFSEKHPMIDLVLLAGETSQVESWAIEKRVDMALLMSTLNYPKTLSVSRAFRFQLCSVTKYVEQCKTLSLSTPELRGERQLIYNVFFKAGLNEVQKISHRAHIVSNTFQMLDLVKAGLGWAVLPRFVCEKALAESSVTEVLIDGQPTTEGWGVDVIWRTDQPLNDATSDLLATFQSLDDK